MTYEMCSFMQVLIANITSEWWTKNLQSFQGRKKVNKNFRDDARYTLIVFRAFNKHRGNKKYKQRFSFDLRLVNKTDFALTWHSP